MKDVESEIPTGPNWLELPRDLTQNILQRLTVVEIVTSACLVCPLWWNICKEPTMWRTIDMRNRYTSHYDFAKIFMYAIDRSCGQVEDINIELFGNDELLICISDCASNLRRLRIAISWTWKISEEILSKVATKLPLLEELDISFFQPHWNTREIFAQSCPLLKSLKFSSSKYIHGDDEAFAVSKMSRLRHLKLSRFWLCDDGLLSILEGCPHLESLDLEECYNFALSECVVKRGHGQMKDFLPPSSDFLEDYTDSDVPTWESLLDYNYDTD